MEDKGEYKLGAQRHNMEECVQLVREISSSVGMIATDVNGLVDTLTEVPKIAALVDEKADDIHAGLDAVADIVAGIAQMVAGARKIGKLPKSVRAFMVKKAIAYFDKKE